MAKGIIKKEDKKEEVIVEEKATPKKKEEVIVEEKVTPKKEDKKEVIKKNIVDEKDKLIAELKAKLDEEKNKNKDLVNMSEQGIEIRHDKFEKKIYIPKANITLGKVAHRDTPKVTNISKKLINRKN